MLICFIPCSVLWVSRGIKGWIEVEIGEVFHSSQLKPGESMLRRKKKKISDLLYEKSKLMCPFCSRKEKKLPFYASSSSITTHFCRLCDESERKTQNCCSSTKKVSDDDLVSNFIRFCWIATFHVWDHQHVSIPPLNTEHWNPPGPFSIRVPFSTSPSSAALSNFTNITTQRANSALEEEKSGVAWKL